MINQFQSTLPRGERLHYHPLSKDYHDFNPRSHEGSDGAGTKMLGLMLFQSTLPRGERRNSHAFTSFIAYFNPRSHEGSDGCHGNQRRRDSISIHAPTRGATQRVIINETAKKFQSTLPRGERRVPRKPTQTGQYFNPRSHEGSDGKRPELGCVYS